MKIWWVRLHPCQPLKAYLVIDKKTKKQISANQQQKNIKINQFTKINDHLSIYTLNMLESYLIFWYWFFGKHCKIIISVLIIIIIKRVQYIGIIRVFSVYLRWLVKFFSAWRET